MAEKSDKALKTFGEILKGQGMTDEAAQKITEDLKSNSIYLTSEENIDVRYQKLKSRSDEADKEIAELRKANEELRNAGEDAKALQERITGYESKVSELEGKLKAQSLDSALKIAALSSGAQDPDYIAYKLSGGNTLELDGDGKVKGIDEMLEALRQAHPSQFTSAKAAVIPAKLSTEEPQTVPGVTKDQFERMSYSERLGLYKADPETYKSLAGKKQE